MPFVLASLQQSSQETPIQWYHIMNYTVSNFSSEIYEVVHTEGCGTVAKGMKQ